MGLSSSHPFAQLKPRGAAAASPRLVVRQVVESPNVSSYKMVPNLRKKRIETERCTSRVGREETNRESSIKLAEAEDAAPAVLHKSVSSDQVTVEPQ